MTAAKIDTEERKKLIADLWIIGIVSFLALGIVVFAMQNGMILLSHENNTLS